MCEACDGNPALCISYFMLRSVSYGEKLLAQGCRPTVIIKLWICLLFVDKHMFLLFLSRHKLKCSGNGYKKNELTAFFLDALYSHSFKIMFSH